MIDARHSPAQPARLQGLPLDRLTAACRTWAAGPLRRSVWLIASCIVLAALAFVTHPGHIIADTKLDLAVNPEGFLARALHPWDPSQFGQLQDQAVGYIFPVGLFFLLGKVLAVHAWVVQRLWIACILLAAFLGIVRLCTRLEIGTPATRIAAGFSYALAPNALSMLGVLSSEFLPIAMLPWILIPLVRAVHAGPRPSAGVCLRATAQSAVAVAICSGINAAATFAVLIPAVIYLLTAPRLAPRWRIMAWWAPAVLLATSWWLYPLLLQGKYGVSILPYTETAATTTGPTSLFNTLRGTENWITYLVLNGKPWWPVAFRISAGSLPTILTGLVAGLGLAGLVSRRVPHRRFLLCVLLLGVFAILTGHVSSLGNPLAAPLDHLIDGPLVPFRNLRKFDPLIRLPITLGLANLLASVRLQLPRRTAGLAAAGAVGLLALPVYLSGLSTPGSFPAIPSYWVHAADWLNRHAGHQGVVEEPGARFGQYTWGSPMDDVLQPLMTGNWASIQLSVLGSVGNTRLLQAIDQQMAAGDGSAGLTTLLARMDVKYVVVRNDLLRADLRGAWPARIHQALDTSPGMVKVAQFGSTSVGSHRPGNAVSSFDSPYPPVEIYQVDGARPVAVVQPTSQTMRVFGAPEALITLANDNVLKNRPVLLNSDDPQVQAGSTIVTDSLRRRDRNFGEIRVDYSPTLTAGSPLGTADVPADYLEPGWQPYLAVAKYYGISNVIASSAVSGIYAHPTQSATGLLPYAAIDGNLATRWESGTSGAVGQWIKIYFTRPLSPGIIRVAFADEPAVGPPVTRVSLTTAAGKVVDPVKVTASFQSLRAPAGRSRWLKITVKAVRAMRGKNLVRHVGIKEISIPGVYPSRTIEAPDVQLPGGADPSAVMLAKAEPQPSGCMLTSARWVCSPELEKPTEEQYGFNESFTVRRAGTATLSGSAVLTSTPLIERYGFAGKDEPAVTASSSYTSAPQDLPSSAFDANPLTTWISGASDPHPALTIAWHGSKEVSTVTILRPPGVSNLLPVRIAGSDGQVRTGAVGGQGPRSSFSRISFAPMKTSSVTLTFAPKHGPVQITEVEIPGVRPLTSHSASRFALPCGLGPKVTVNGTVVPTQVSGTGADVLEGEPMTFSACAKVSVAAGDNRVVEPSSDGFSIQSAVLDRPAPRLLSAAPTAPMQAATIISWTSSKRVLRVTASQQSYLSVAENFNAGWQATLRGRVLQPVQLDGWQQGWVLPAGASGEVTLRYLPDGPYRASVFGGLIAVAVIMIIAFVPLRRRRTANAGAAEVKTTEPVAEPVATAEAWPWQRFLGRRRPLIGRPPSAALVAGLAATAFYGLWVAGYPGIFLLPAVTAAFLTAPAFAPGSRLCTVLAGRWLVAGLLVAASGFVVLGEHLALGDGLSSLLSDTIPQLLCLAIVGRLAAALLLSAIPETSTPVGAQGLEHAQPTVSSDQILPSSPVKSDARAEDA